jgi:hypothetical protein
MTSILGAAGKAILVLLITADIMSKREHFHHDTTSILTGSHPLLGLIKINLFTLMHDIYILK